jgi:hypothetical protein
MLAVLCVKVKQGMARQTYKEEGKEKYSRQGRL